MATFTQRIEVGSPDQKTFEALDALVDTGATYTWVPRDILTQLGIQPAFTRPLRLPDGSIIEREAAQVPLRLENQVLLTICIFGDEGTQSLLGAVTLEEFGLGVDPLNQRLVPIVSLLM